MNTQQLSLLYKAALIFNIYFPIVLVAQSQLPTMTEKDSICLDNSFIYFYENGEGHYLASYDNRRFLTDSSGTKTIDLEYYDNPLYLSFSSNRLAVKEKTSRLYGFINAQGELVIPHKYSSTTEFIDGFSAVKYKGEYGIIDTMDRIVFEFDEHELNSPINGLIPQKVNSKWGLANFNGDVIIKHQYDKIGTVNRNFFYAYDSKKDYLLDLNGKEVLPSTEFDKVEYVEENIYKVKKNDKFGIVNSEGQEIVPIEWTAIRTRNKNLYVVSKDKKRGVIAKTGELTIPIEYDNIQIFDNYIFTLKNKNKQLYDTKGNLLKEEIFDNLNNYGPCNLFIKAITVDGVRILYSNGEDVVDKTFEKVENISEGMLLGKHDKSWKYYSVHDGSQLFGESFSVAKPFYKQRGIVKKDSKMYLMNTEGKKVSPEYDFLERNENMYKFRNGNRWGLMDSELQPILTADYEDIKYFSSSVFRVKQNGRYGLHNGDRLLLDMTFNNISMRKASCKNLILEKNGLLGLARIDGKVILEPEVNKIMKCAYGLTIVVKDQKFGIIDQEGDYFAPIIYDEINKIKSPNHVSVKSNGKWGFINKDGELSIEPKFEELIRIEAGPYIALAKHSNGWSLISKKGEIVREFESVQKMRRSYIVKENGKFGVLDMIGKTQHESKFDYIQSDNKLAYFFIAESNGKFGVITDRGKQIIDITYNKIESDDDQYICTDENNLITIFDNRGNLMVGPIDATFVRQNRNWIVYRMKNNPKYAIAKSLKSNNVGSGKNCEDIHDLSEHHAKCITSTGIGVIDTINKEILKPEFDDIFAYTIGEKNFKQDYFWVKKNEQEAIFNTKGNITVNFDNRHLSQIYTSKYVETTVKRDNSDLRGIIDINGNELLSPIYKNIGFRVVEGIIYIQSTNEKCGYYNFNTNKVIDLNFEKCSNFDDGLAIVAIKHENSNENIFGVIDTQGKQLLPFYYSNLSKANGACKDCYKATYLEMKFEINLRGECTKNCPSQDILDELSLIKADN